MVKEKNTLAKQELNKFANFLPGSSAFVGLLPAEQTYIINLKRDEMISEYKIKAYDARYNGSAAIAKVTLTTFVCF